MHLDKPESIEHLISNTKRTRKDHHVFQILSNEVGRLERAPQGKGLFAWPPTGWYLGCSSIPLVEILSIHGINVIFSGKGQKRFFEEKKGGCIMLLFFSFSAVSSLNVSFSQVWTSNKFLRTLNKWKNNFVDRHVNKNVMFDGTKPSNPMPAPVEQRSKPLADISDWWEWRDPYNDGKLIPNVTG